VHTVTLLHAFVLFDLIYNRSSYPTAYR